MRYFFLEKKYGRPKLPGQTTVRRLYFVTFELRCKSKRTMYEVPIHTWGIAYLHILSLLKMDYRFSLWFGCVLQLKFLLVNANVEFRMSTSNINVILTCIILVRVHVTCNYITYNVHVQPMQHGRYFANANVT